MLPLCAKSFEKDSIVMNENKIKLASKISKYTVWLSGLKYFARAQKISGCFW